MTKILTQKKVKKTPKMNKVTETKNYKFNIYDRLTKYTAEAKKKKIKRVAAKAGRAYSTCKNVVYTKIDSDTSIDYKILKAFASLFMVSVEELEN